jgi:hypothetical protein
MCPGMPTTFFRVHWFGERWGIVHPDLEMVNEANLRTQSVATLPGGQQVLVYDSSLARKRAG